MPPSKQTPSTEERLWMTFLLRMRFMTSNTSYFKVCSQTWFNTSLFTNTSFYGNKKNLLQKWRTTNSFNYLVLSRLTVCIISKSSNSFESTNHISRYVIQTINSPFQIKSSFKYTIQKVLLAALLLWSR